MSYIQLKIIKLKKTKNKYLKAALEPPLWAKFCPMGVASHLHFGQGVVEPPPKVKP
jgi:hypothetical protein